MARLDLRECEFCRSGRENLCAQARFTGYQIDGGYSEFTIADQRFCFAIPADTAISRPRRCSAPD